MKKIALWSLAVLMVLSSCNPLKSLDVRNIAISEFRMESSTKASIILKVKVENDAQHTITLSSMEGSLKKDMDLFATAVLKEEVVVPPMGQSDVMIPVDITLCDPMSLLSLGLNVKKWNLDEFFVNGKIVVLKNGRAKKTYKLKNKSLKSLVSYLEK